jgi:ATP-binding cassette subfamily C protein LapB
MAVNIATFLQQITSIIIVLFGMYLVQDGTLSMGGLIAGVILGGRALSPIGQIASLLTKYHQAGGALKTLDNIMAQPVERPDNKQFLHRADIEGGMSFKDVSFEYPGTQRKILNGVTFHIAPGEKVGIIGRIGSGKSTITRLIMGFYDHDDGSILIDDTDLRQIDPADLRRHVAYISQDIMLFTGSVRDNIAAGLPQASEARILDVAKASGVHDFISKHPQGYDAQVGEQGAFLSGGQKQAIALARAMITDPKVLVCDEPMPWTHRLRRRFVVILRSMPKIRRLLWSRTSQVYCTWWIVCWLLIKGGSLPMGHVIKC